MGRRALIDREAVIKAGFELARDDGIGAVTMQAVSQRLGVTTMALYYHFVDKAELIEGIVERLFFEIELPEDDLPWRERLRALAVGLRTNAQHHPELFSMLLRQPSTTPGAERLRDTILSALHDAGLGHPQVPQTERILSTLLLGFLTSEVGGRFDDVDETEHEFSALQALLVEIVELRVARSPDGAVPATEQMS